MRPDYVFFRETVEFLPGFYLLVVVGGLTLVFIPITLAHRSGFNKKNFEGISKSFKVGAERDYESLYNVSLVAR